MKAQYNLFLLNFILISTNLINSKHSETILFDNNATIDITKINLTTFKVTFRAPLDSWVGIGYGSSMKNTDMNLLELYSNKTYKLYDSYSLGYEIPKDDEKLGGNFDLLEPVFLLENESFANVTYYRKYDTKDKYDAVLNPDISTNLIFAWGNGQIQFHGSNYRLVKFDFAELTSKEKSSSLVLYWKWHHWGLSMNWTFLSALGFILVRYFKHKNYSVLFHAIIMGFISLFTICFVLSAYALNDFKIGNKTKDIKNLHHISVTIFSFLFLIQLILGIYNYIRNYIKADSLLNSNVFFTKRIHMIIGYILYLSSMVNIITGFLNSFQKDYVFLPITVIGILILLIAYLEIKTYKSNVNKIKQINEKYNNLLRATGKKSLNKYDLISVKNILEASPETIIVIYDNLLIDMTDFVKIHPGGKHLIYSKEMNEIGRYLLGNQPISSKINSHNHGFSAINKILDDLVIGTLENTNFLIYKTEDYMNTENKHINENNFNYDLEILGLKKTEDISLKRKLSGFSILNNLELDNFYNNKIIFENKIEVADNLCKLNFKLLGYKFPLFMKGHEWCGKYVTLVCEKLNLARNYTICLSLGELNQEKLKILYSNLILLEKKYENTSIRVNQNNQLNINSEDLSITQLEDSSFNNMNLKVLGESIQLEKINNLNQTDLVGDTFNLYVKCYQKHDGMSKALHNMKKGDSIIMRAPIGLGLRLENKLNGIHVMMGRGTGNLSYLDFICFILRFIFYKIPKDNFQFNNNLIDNENFECIDASFKLVFFASYFNEKNSFLHDILKEADRLDKKYKLGVFQYIYNFEKNVSKTKWNANFFIERFKNDFDQIKFVYLCGTIQFIDQMKDELENTNRINNDQFIYV